MMNIIHSDKYIKETIHTNQIQIAANIVRPYIFKLNLTDENALCYCVYMNISSQTLKTNNMFIRY